MKQLKKNLFSNVFGPIEIKPAKAGLCAINYQPPPPGLSTTKRWLTALHKMKRVVIVLEAMKIM
jgi:hypothetical protein